jgi:hypothetical protein
MEEQKQKRQVATRLNCEITVKRCINVGKNSEKGIILRCQLFVKLEVVSLY